jgi:dolichol-phosphate mannosyltransferase
VPSASIIIPVFNERENIKIIYDSVNPLMKENDELLFVDDGSNDGTFEIIRMLSLSDHRVKCISFSRNFGHQNALMAGMANCSGEYIITMDGDLQHPPSMIPDMINKLNEGYDLVITKRNKTENIGPVKNILSGVFYRFINAISDTRIEPNVSDFRAFNKTVLASILLFKEREIFLRGIFSWVGFKSYTLHFNAPKRQFGKTKYPFVKMMRFALKAITSFGFKPLRIAILVGSIISLAAFIFGFYALISYFRGNTVPGWASTIIAIMFLGGTQLLAIGLLGEYIASLFIETKKRPLYIIKEKVNMQNETGMKD